MSWLVAGLRVHVIGVAGAGMSGVARLLSQMGCVVSGSDRSESATLAALAHEGIRVWAGHDERHVEGAQVVLWSPAVAPDNVELVAARRAGARLVTRASLLAELATLTRVLGVTGTHGKTTATSMLVHVLRAAGRDDAYLLGANVLGVGANGHWGPGDLALELDESYGTFAELHPYAVGLLNVEADHLDYYGTLEGLEAAFTDLLGRTKGPVVAWTDDDGARRVVALSGRPCAEVGRRPDAPWRVSREVLTRRSSSFTLSHEGDDLELTLGVTGRHNVANAALVSVLALELGVASDAVVTGLAAFQGVPRRFEFHGTWRGADVYEDYAHLPGEIAATLAAARAAGYERVTAVFQPHRVTRTQHLAGSFAPAFDEADTVIVTDIYLAGEENPEGLTGEVVATPLALRRPRTSTRYAATTADVVAALEEVVGTSDALFLLGAGDMAHVVTQLIGVTS